jgi:hypothetical protein
VAIASTFPGIAVGPNEFANTWDVFGPLIKERLWPNPRYKWLSGVLHHRNSRVTAPSNVAYNAHQRPLVCKSPPRPYMAFHATPSVRTAKAKDWYDIAFALLNNDHGNPSAAAERLTELFGPSIINVIHAQLLDLQANFADAHAQGTLAYINQITLDHPDLDPDVAAADAQLAVEAFTDDLLRGRATP